MPFLVYYEAGDLTMAYKCDMCGKGKMIGQQHKHHPGVAGGRWKKRAPHVQKVFKPNLHTARILVGTVRQTMKLCTKCLRRAKELVRAQKAPKTTSVVTA